MSKDQWEEESIERFREFLSHERNTVYAITGRDILTDLTTGGNFDYQLTDKSGHKVAVELFRLVESGKELAGARVWNQVVKLLKKALEERSIKGYLVALPPLEIPLREAQDFSKRAVETIASAIQAHSGTERFTEQGFTFYRVEGLETISFSTGAEARAINPHGTAAKVFAEKLPKKNKQVSIDDHERILVVVNWAIIVDEDDVIRALSCTDFEEFSNVDRIFFEVRSNSFKQVYSKSIAEAIKGQNSRTADDPQLLKEYIKYQLAEKRRPAFDFVRVAAAEAGNMLWLTDKHARETLARYGVELIQLGLIDDALWIIRQLKDDPNPSNTGENDPDDPEGEFNYHRRIEKGEDESLITTVRGHLCWLIARVVCQNKPAHYSELIQITRSYLFGANLYIRMQAMVPLMELVRRRNAIKNQDDSPFEWDQEGRDQVKAMTFQALQENTQYPQILKSLLHVFDHMRDLNESEARAVLTTFLASGVHYVLHDLATFIVYFALFRKDDFKADGPFDAREFIDLLKNQISFGKPSMRSSLAWHLWKIIHEKYLPYEEVRKYLPLFWGNEYDQNLASMFGLIFEELVSVDPGDACELFSRMLEDLKKFSAKNPDSMREIWITETEKIVPLFAIEPMMLVEVVKNLVDAWNKGVFIGELKPIFESYHLVDVNQRDLVKEEFRKMHAQMKQVHPKLVEVDWSN